MKLNKSLLSVHEYSLDGEVSGSDYVIGEDANSGFETKNFTFNKISIEVWGVGEAGQVLTATGDGRYVWTDDASESDIPATTTSTTAGPTTTTTTSAPAATTTTTTSSTSTPNTSVPDICLSSYNPVTFSTINGVNSYVFSGTYGSYKVTTGTHTLTGVPSTHPIAILNSGKTSAISYTGTTSGGSKTALDGQTYTYYYGNITITVNSDFGTVSYECYNHGYMGGQNNLSYDASCVQPVTTTTTSSPTTTTTTAFVNPIQGQCYKNDPAFNGGGYGPAMLSYFLDDGTEEFLSYKTIPILENLKVGDKINRFGFCYTVACLHPTTPKIGGFLSIITSGGSYGYSSRQNYPSGFCVDSDPDNVTTTTTTTQALTTTTTTSAPTTTTTTLNFFDPLPVNCGYALWRGTQVGSTYCQISYWPSHPSSSDDYYVLFRPKPYACRTLNNHNDSALSLGDIAVFNFYNVNNTQIGPNYYYKRVSDLSAYQGGVPPKSGELIAGSILQDGLTFGAQDLLGNDPIKDLGYYYAGGGPYGLQNITFLARHTNSGGTNECLITLPPNLITTTTTSAPTTTTTTSAPTTTTTTLGEYTCSNVGSETIHMGYFGDYTASFSSGILHTSASPSSFAYNTTLADIQRTVTFGFTAPSGYTNAGDPISCSFNVYQPGRTKRYASSNLSGERTWRFTIKGSNVPDTSTTTIDLNVTGGLIFYGYARPTVVSGDSSGITWTESSALYFKVGLSTSTYSVTHRSDTEFTSIQTDNGNITKALSILATDSSGYPINLMSASGVNKAVSEYITNQQSGTLVDIEKSNAQGYNIATNLFSPVADGYYCQKDQNDQIRVQSGIITEYSSIT